MSRRGPLSTLDRTCPIRLERFCRPKLLTFRPCCKVESRTKKARHSLWSESSQPRRSLIDNIACNFGLITRNLRYRLSSTRRTNGILASSPRGRSSGNDRHNCAKAAAPLSNWPSDDCEWNRARSSLRWIGHSLVESTSIKSTLLNQSSFLMIDISRVHSGHPLSNQTLTFILRLLTKFFHS
jgi:hypothetical protein